MTKAWSHLLFLVFMAAGMACATAGPLVPGEPGTYVFTSQGPLRAKPVTVHYYRAKSAQADARVLFAMHGVQRNAKRARDYWIDVAERHGLVILAPEFDQARFPRRLYQLGGMEQADRAKWTFGLIEEMFDKVRAEEGLAAPSYLMFGHSAGAQFAHRFALMMDGARASMIVTANAGSYTLPVYTGPANPAPFPWALDEERVAPEALRAALGRNVLVLLGEEDTRTDDADLVKTPEAMAQGAHRLERGRYFFAAAAEQARRMDVACGWRLATVPGVGHDARRMSRAAAELIFAKAKP